MQFLNFLKLIFLSNRNVKSNLPFLHRHWSSNIFWNIWNYRQVLSENWNLIIKKLKYWIKNGFLAKLLEWRLHSWGISNDERTGRFRNNFWLSFHPTFGILWIRSIDIFNVSQMRNPCRHECSILNYIIT